MNIGAKEAKNGQKFDDESYMLSQAYSIFS